MQHDAPHASSRDQRTKSTPVPFAVLSQPQASQPAGCCLFYVRLTERFTCGGSVTVGPPAKLARTSAARAGERARRAAWVKTRHDALVSDRAPSANRDPAVLSVS